MQYIFSILLLFFVIFLLHITYAWNKKNFDFSYTPQFTTIKFNMCLCFQVRNTVIKFLKRTLFNEILPYLVSFQNLIMKINLLGIKSDFDVNIHLTKLHSALLRFFITHYCPHSTPHSIVLNHLVQNGKNGKFKIASSIRQFSENLSKKKTTI